MKKVFKNKCVCGDEAGKLAYETLTHASYLDGNRECVCSQKRRSPETEAQKDDSGFY